MTSLRGALAGAGVATIGLGFLFVFQPSLAAGLGVPETALTLLGVIALVEGARSVQERRRSEIDQATPPDPEDRLETSMPGTDFDRLVALGRIGRGRARSRLRGAAVESIELRRGVTAEAAADIVEEGAWTDDPVAAAFVGGPDVPQPPWRVRLRVYLARADSNRYYAERTVEAIAALWEDA